MVWRMTSDRRLQDDGAWLAGQFRSAMLHAKTAPSTVRSLAIASAALVSLAGSASAIERYDLESMTCEQITEGLSRNGPAVLHRSSRNVQRMKIFDVYVGSPLDCSGLVPQKQTVLAKDASCEVFQCIRPNKTWSRIPRSPPPDRF